MKHDKTETVAKCRVLAFKRWLFTMRNIVFHAAFCDLLEKRWFMAELGLVLMKRLEALF